MQHHAHALTIDPTIDDVRVDLIVTYRQWELPDEARRHITEGLRLKPDHASLLWEATQLELVLRDDERFRNIVARSDSVFRQRRQQILDSR